MIKNRVEDFFYNKKGDSLVSKNLVYWFLIGVCVFIILLIVNGIIHKLLTLY